MWVRPSVVESSLISLLSVYSQTCVQGLYLIRHKAVFDTRWSFVGWIISSLLSDKRLWTWSFYKDGLSSQVIYSMSFIVRNSWNDTPPKLNLYKVPLQLVKNCESDSIHKPIISWLLYNTIIFFCSGINTVH